eukprot:jgi/Pico_ML_1/51813/g2660.t1
MLAGSNDPEAKAQLSIGKKIAVSLGTSGLGITLANPSDVVKVRYQAFQGASKAQREYSSVYQAYREIASTEGIWKGLYRGYSANLARNMIISATEITVYDQTKQVLLANGLPDQREGIRSFYKGFWPNFARVGSFNVVLWTSYEQISKLVEATTGG